MRIRAFTFSILALICSATFVFSANLSLTVDSKPAGAKVTCTTGTITGPCSTFFFDGMPVKLTAEPGAQWFFNGWDGDCTGTSITCNLTMDKNKHVIAHFSQPVLTVAKIGDGTGFVGSQSLPGEEISCGNDCNTQNAQQGRGQQIQLTANEAGNGFFDEWIGCPGIPNGNHCTFFLTKNTLIKVRFTRPTLTIVKQGAGAATGLVTSSPAGINCGSVCSAKFNQRTAVVLDGTAGAGNVFVGFVGPSAECDNTNCRMDGNRTLTATFRQPQVTLHAKGENTGSPIVSNPAGINCPPTCTATFQANQGVDLTATSSETSIAEFRPETCRSVSGTTCHIVTNNDVEIQVEFRQLFHLQINLTGAGSVTGTGSTGPGQNINCSANNPDRCSSLNKSRDTISLAVNVPAGEQFQGWTGDCASAGVSLHCVIAMDRDHTVGANFIP